MLFRSWGGKLTFGANQKNREVRDEGLPVWNGLAWTLRRGCRLPAIPGRLANRSGRCRQVSSSRGTVEQQAASFDVAAA